jgi:hypothetical protein
MDTTTIMVALIGGCVTVLTAIIGTIATLVQQGRIRSQNQQILEQGNAIKGYKLPRPIPIKDKRNTILLIALGGTGKTALIKSLFQNPDANPEQETLAFDIYCANRASNKEGDTETQYVKYWFRIADYKGQNIGDLIRAFIEQQRNPYPLLAYGFIDSLIIMVDLIPPKPAQDAPDVAPSSSVNSERINFHLAQWNDTAINAIFGLLTSELKYACLFINKIDLMTDRSPSADEMYKNEFKDLADRIKKRCGKARFEIVLGSALKGTQVNILEHKLMEHSAPSEGE